MLLSVSLSYIIQKSYINRTAAVQSEINNLEIMKIPSYDADFTR